MSQLVLAVALLSGCADDACVVMPMPAFPSIHITVVANDVIMSVEDYTAVTRWTADVAHWSNSIYQCE